MAEQFSDGMRVFVYGSLKAGHWNHRVLSRHGAEFIGRATTAELYLMHDVGFPLIRPSNEGYPVAGEVYEIKSAEALADLDRLESEGDMYDRVPLMLDGYSEPVQGYVWHDAKMHGAPVNPGAGGVIEWEGRR